MLVSSKSSTRAFEPAGSREARFTAPVLLDGMIDLVFSEIGLPWGGAGWTTAMRQRAVSARQVLSRHRWAIGRWTRGARPVPPRCGTTTP